jgi:homoserine kinase type II
MAAFTTPSEDELRAFLQAAGLGNYEKFQSVEGGSVNSNFSFFASGRRWFLRIYEEQDDRGAAAEQAMVAALARGGVRTPVAAFSGRLANKPAAILPWVDGAMSCQRGVSTERAAAVGAALARVHVAGEGLALPEGRFHVGALEARLDRITPAYPVERLRRTLHELAAARDASIPHGLIHGDLFRDNVLWGSDTEIAALLDFESASRGAFVYDVAVTLLAWCYGDALEAPLARALASGYGSVRPLAEAEKHALYTEARLAAVRFTITRITDYAMRGGEGRVMKDWRRFLARLDALEAMGEAGLLALFR